MALESVEALAVRTRLSESHCHPPREMRKGRMGGLAMRAITAYRAWPLHADDWRPEGWWCGSGGAVETFMLWNKCRPSRITTGIVENEIESDHAGGGRMASIGVETVSTPARLKAACASFDASQSRCQETRTQACKRASHQPRRRKKGKGKNNPRPASQPEL